MAEMRAPKMRNCRATAGWIVRPALRRFLSKVPWNCWRSAECRTKAPRRRPTQRNNRNIRPPRILLLSLAVRSWGRPQAAYAHEVEPARLSADHQPAIFKNIGIEQRLGAKFPLQASFATTAVRRFGFNSYFRIARRAGVYLSELPDALPSGARRVVRSLKPFSLDVARDFDVIVISIDERDTSELAHKKKAEIISRYGRDGSGVGWHFLTGDKSAIEGVTRALDSTMRGTNLANSTYMLPGFSSDAQGEIARVLYGIDYLPRDVRLALVEAARGKIGTPSINCCCTAITMIPLTGKYGWAVMGSLRICRTVDGAGDRTPILRQCCGGSVTASGDFADV